MTGDIVWKRSLPAGMARGRCRAGGAGRVGVALGVIASVGLAGAGPAWAQLDGSPQTDLGAAAPDDVRPAAEPDVSPAAAEPGEMPPLADDGAVTVTSPSANGATPRARSAKARTGQPWSRNVDIARRQAARQLFLQANDSARRRFFATAAVKYKQAFQLWPHPAFAYNLALAQRQLDQPVEAHANLERAIAHGPAPLAGRYEQAQQQLAEIETELAPVEVVCGEPGAHVMLDGKLLFTGPGQHRGVMRPGAHQLVATRRGLIPVVEQIVVAPGEPARFTLAFEQPGSDRVSRRGWAAISAAGAGVALLLAGGTLDWHSSRLFDDYRRDFVIECPMGCRDGAPPELERRRHRAEKEQHAAVAGYALGGAALATGLVLTLLDPGHEDRRRAEPAPHRAARAAPRPLGPLVSPGVIGMSAGFRF